jgi:hypothetical protein
MEEKSQSIYYAHHRWKYGTQIEAYELDLIRRYFPTSTVFNPSEHLDVKGRSEEDIMKECLEHVRDSDIIIFSSMDGVIGKGVYEELQEAHKTDKLVLYILWDRLINANFEILAMNDSSNGDRTYALIRFDESDARIFTRS